MTEPLFDNRYPICPYCEKENNDPNLNDGNSEFVICESCGKKFLIECHVAYDSKPDDD